MDRAIETLDSWEGEGNLLMASFIKPHHPFDPPAPWHEMYDPSSLTLLPGWTDPEDILFSKGYFPHADLNERKLRRVMAYYYGSISHIDHHLGRMIDSLRASGLYDDTLIVYNSDHGEYLGFHHMKGKGNRMYDPLVRVSADRQVAGSDARSSTTGRSGQHDRSGAYFFERCRM